MKKLSLLFLVTILLFSCNNDDEQDLSCDNGVFIGDVILKTQQEVDNFGALCYSKIAGRLLIGNPDFNYATNSDLTNIENLISLSGLVEIEDGLTIQACPSLRNLEGLDGLTSIGEIANLVIYNCSSLSTIAQLSSLVNNNVESVIELTDNILLTSLKGLEGFTAASRVVITASSIVNLEGLNNVDYVRALHIGGNEMLTSLYGIHNATEMELLGITKNNMLTSFSEINDQVKLKYFGLYNNNSITSLQELNGNFNNEEMVWMVLRYNEGLNSIGNLEGIESIGDLWIRYNDNLETIGGFPNLVKIRGVFYINHNSNLTNLNGLESLIQVGGYGLSNNSSLTDFCGIENLIVNGNGAEISQYGPTLDYLQGNAYNPTVQDIIDGNCSQ